MLQDSGLKVVLTEGGLPAETVEYKGQLVFIDLDTMRRRKSADNALKRKA